MEYKVSVYKNTKRGEIGANRFSVYSEFEINDLIDEEIEIIKAILNKGFSHFNDIRENVKVLNASDVMLLRDHATMEIMKGETGMRRDYYFKVRHPFKKEVKEIGIHVEIEKAV